MTKEKLAEVLRSQLAEKCARGELDGSLPGGQGSFLRTLQAASHDNLIAGFLKCPVCGEMTMPVERATQLAAHLETAEDWIKGLAAWREKFGGCRHGVGKNRPLFRRDKLEH